MKYSSRAGSFAVIPQTDEAPSDTGVASATLTETGNWSLARIVPRLTTYPGSLRSPVPITSCACAASAPASAAAPRVARLTANLRVISPAPEDTRSLPLGNRQKPSDVPEADG